MKKNVYIRITESLCCIAVINTTLYMNYTSIKKIFFFVVIKWCHWFLKRIVSLHQQLHQNSHRTHNRGYKDHHHFTPLLEPLNSLFIETLLVQSKHQLFLSCCDTTWNFCCYLIHPLILLTVVGKSKSLNHNFTS